MTSPTATVYLNRNQDTKTDTYTQRAISGTTRMFSAANGSFRLASKLAEFIIYDRSLSLAERNQVEDYLSAKYNITLTP